MNPGPFEPIWQVDLGHEIAARAPVVLADDRVVVPLATGLAWVDLPAGQVRHVERGERAVVGLAGLGDGVVAARQDRGAVRIDAFDAAGATRWKARLDVGVGADCLHVLDPRVVVVGSDAGGLHAVFLDAGGRASARWPLPAADVRAHRGELLCALAMPVDGRCGVLRAGPEAGGAWLVDAPPFAWALAGDFGALDTWNGQAAQSELVGFALDGSGECWRAAGGPNAALLPTGGCLAHLETAAGGPVVVLRDLADGRELWRSARVGRDEPGLFGRCSGAATLLEDDVVVWLHGRGLVRLARADGAPRGESPVPALPPAGVTPTPHGLLVCHDRQLTLLRLTP